MPSEQTPSLDDRLRELLDKQEIQECLLRYCRGIDRHDTELARSAYHDDALDDHGTYVGSGYGLVDWANHFHDQVWVRHQHYITNTLIELDGDTAHAETYYFMGCANKKDFKCLPRRRALRRPPRAARRSLGHRRSGLHHRMVRRAVANGAHRATRCAGQRGQEGRVLRAAAPGRARGADRVRDGPDRRRQGLAAGRERGSRDSYGGPSPCHRDAKQDTLALDPANARSSARQAWVIVARHAHGQRTPAVGRMFWLMENRLPGSYRSLRATSRSYTPGPNDSRTRSSSTASLV